MYCFPKRNLIPEKRKKKIKTRQTRKKQTNKNKTQQNKTNTTRATEGP